MDSVAAHLSTLEEITEISQLELGSHLIRIERLELKGPGSFEYNYNVPISAFYSFAKNPETTMLSIIFDDQPFNFVVAQLSDSEGQAIEDYQIEATSSEEGIHLQANHFEPTTLAIHKATNPFGEILSAVHQTSGIKPSIFLRHPTNQATIASIRDYTWDFGRAANYAAKQGRHFLHDAEPPSDSDSDDDTQDDTAEQPTAAEPDIDSTTP